MVKSPQGVAVDSAGGLYIADTGNNRIRKVAGGNITTVAGGGTAGDGGPATGASLSGPIGVAVDSAGNLYIADTGNNRVRKVAGVTITTVAGNGTGKFAGDGGPAISASLNAPEGVAVDSAGNLFIADHSNLRIRKVSSGTITTVAGNPTFTGDGVLATSATLGGVASVAVDSAGNLYISDSPRVRKVTSGTINTVAGGGDSTADTGPATGAFLNGAAGVAVDSAGNLYIAEARANRIRKVSGGTITTVAGNGTAGFGGDGGIATSALLANPTGVAVDSAGNLYIADTNNNRIRKVSAAGTITTVAGSDVQGFSGDGRSAIGAALFRPQGVALDSAGNLYIADTNNSRIRMVSGGIINTVAGNGNFVFSGDGGPATSASLNFPGAVTLDSAGNLYVADTNNNRIRRVSGGTISTVAGNGVQTFAGDGGLAAGASLFHPSGVALDSAGNLYIADPNNYRVREVLVKLPSYQTSPAALSFSATAGGSAPGSQTVTLASAVPGLAFTASASATWLTVSPSTGTVPATLQVTADPTTLTANTYTGTITVTAPNANPATATIAVTFNVQPSAAAALGVDTQNLSFATTQGASAVTQQLQIANTGSGSLDFTASAAITSGGSWLSISAAGGTATPSSPASLTVTATPGSLPPGTYSGTIAIAGAGKNIAVAVILSISAPNASILLTQSALSFTTVEQGGVPLPQNFGILNTGQGSMSWTATAATLSGGNWLQISATDGRVERPYLDVSQVNVSIDPSTLAAGTYYGRIRVSASAVNTPQVMTVILTVMPAGTKLGAQVFPAGLVFTGVAGSSPGSQDVMVGNPAGTANNFVSSSIGTGFSYLPTSGTVDPNRPATVRVYPDFTNLKAGTIQNGTITLQFSDGSPAQTVGVLIVVAPAGTTPSSLTGHAKGPAIGQPQASGCGQGLSVLWRSPQPFQSTFKAVSGQSTGLEVQVTDLCGNPASPGSQNAVKASFSNGDPASLMNYNGSGVWQGTWKPGSPGTVTMFVNAFVVDKNGNLLTGQSPTLTGVVTAGATPKVTQQGVVHAASAQGGVPIAPGGLISVYGQDLAESMGVSSGLPLPEQLNGAQVLLGDQLLPILYTSSDQLNVQVPYGVPVNTQYQLSVQRGNALSVPQQLVVSAAQPGIFTVNQQGTGQGSIVKSDGVTLAQPGTPASIGETIVIYCAGLGTVTPRVSEGVAPPGVPPLSKTDNDVTVMIGGKAARVDFSGLTPGDPGLYQINAVVPSGIATGDAVPVVISVAGQTSPTSPAVTIAVR
jgi:uncharacterized protein (TIGR03437 family)